ncbi:MAG: LysM peptidoglycan-binding domain-containing protein [Anaerolineae bacterium]|nr:LysM peptidoglycan-binding domain-containing protein [Anaerolineae bacterium]
MAATLCLSLMPDEQSDYGESKPGWPMPVAAPSQKCPLCGAIQPVSARTCAICGAALTGEPLAVPVPQAKASHQRGAASRFDPGAGDDDLYAGDLSGRTGRLLLAVGLVALLLLGMLLGLAVAHWAGGGGGGREARTEGMAPPTAPPTSTPRALTPAHTPTPTRDVMMSLPTVTPMPPTATPTPTVTPCYQTAGQGDTVLGMAYRCGHRELAVVDVILEINGMGSPQELQLGQTLEIPWPTPTPAPGQELTASAEGAESEAQNPEMPATLRVNAFGTPDALAKYENIEPTLRPGQAWHVVEPGQTILGIAYIYDTTIETLSQINPELPFLQCDYGDPTGGPNCVVMLYERQRVRVPVPLPTPTLSPTPSGTLTPTPSLTPTFNAPYALGPEDGARFAADQLVTLRWGSTGTLGAQERYVVRVRDLDTGQQYTAMVVETSYILPGGWQPRDRNRHTFEWHIAVGELDEWGAVIRERNVSEPRRFIWDSR